MVAAFTPIATNHSIEVDVALDLPHVLANRFSSEQVLGNLLDNAVKYSPHGARVTVAARYQPERQRIVIGVSDQGIGIAPEDQARIFSPHERVTRRETKNLWGVGLGLYIVKGLVELMGGEVWVESELDQGSTFFFTLPTPPVEMTSVHSPGAGESDHGQRKPLG